MNEQITKQPGTGLGLQTTVFLLLGIGKGSLLRLLKFRAFALHSVRLDLTQSLQDAKLGRRSKMRGLRKDRLPRGRNPVQWTEFPQDLFPLQ